jgi:hypothetical protein
MHVLDRIKGLLGLSPKALPVLSRPEEMFLGSFEDRDGLLLWIATNKGTNVSELCRRKISRGIQRGCPVRYKALLEFADKVESRLSREYFRRREKERRGPRLSFSTEMA